MKRPRPSRPPRASERASPRRAPSAPRRASWLQLDGPATTADPAWATPAAWIAIGLTAILLAIVAFALHPVGDYFTESDFYGGYAEGARLIQHGHLDPRRYGVIGPVYEVALALVGLAIPALFRAAETLSVLAAVAMLGLWFEIVRRRFGALAGLWTVAFLVANPTFLRYGYSATTDVFATALQAGALFAVLAGRGRWAPVLAGALAALAFLTRYNAIYLVPAGLAAYLFFERPEGLGRGRAALLFLGGFAALAVPWVAIALASGAAPGSLLFHNVAYDVYAKGRGISWDEYQHRLQPGFHSVLDVLARDPGAVVARELENLSGHARAIVTSLLGWPVALACALGVVVVTLERGWRRMLPIAIAALLLFATLVPVFYADRYVLPLAPMLLALAGVALASRRLALRLGAFPVPLKALAALVPLAWSAHASWNTQRFVLGQLPIETVEAGRVLSALAPRGVGVVARKGATAFYADARAVPFPSLKTLPELADYCRQQKASYLFFSWYEGELRPDFWYLLDTTAVVPGLAIAHVTHDKPSVLYRIGPEFGTLPAWFADPKVLRHHLARAQIMAVPIPLAWSSYLTLGVEAREKGDYREALRFYSIAAQGKRDYPLTWVLMGEANVYLERLDQARACYERALEIDPRSGSAMFGMGLIALRSGRAQEAADIWRRVLPATTNPTNLKMMAELFERLGDTASAQRAQAALERAAPR